MTKNHILIKSVALGVLLTLSPLAKAQSVDRALVTYFDKLYKSQSPKCTINEATKTRILSEIEPKCLVRTTLNNEPFISGVKSECTEASVKTSVDAQVDALCVNTAQKAEQAAVLKAQQQAATAQQANKSGKPSGSAGGLDARTMSQLIKLARTSSSDTSKPKKNEPIKEIPNVGTSSIYGNNMGGSINNAIDKANDAIRKENAARSGETAASVSTQDPKAQAVNDARTEYRTAEEEYKQSGCGQAEDEGKCGELRATMSNAAQKAKDNGGDVEGADADIAAGRATAQRQSDGSLRAAGEAATDQAKAEVEDAELKARHANSRAEDANLKTQLEALDAKIKAMVNAIPAEATATCTAEMGMNPDCGRTQPAITCINTQQQKLIALKTELQKDKEACSNASAQAEKLCSMVRSEKAQNVQKVMSIGATILSKVTAASESCGTTSDLSKIAQGGILAAQGSCIAMKVRCDMNCGSAKKTLEAMDKVVTEMKTCQVGTLKTAPSTAPQVDLGLNNLQAKLKEELSEGKSVPAAVAQCKNHKTDIAMMGVAALGFLSAFQDAQKCKEQLAAGRTGGGSSTSGLAGPTMTTAEYCAQPQNAASITCKCTANPNADGCMGSLAKSGVALGKINANGGASGFASAKQNGLSSVDPLGKTAGESSEPPPGAGLSEAAREALGIGTASPNGSPGVSGNFGSGGENSKAAKEEKEKPKFGFFSSLGSMLSGGRKPDQAAKAAIRNYEQDQAIKRKIASEQLRAQITTASGKSNFDKIRSRYRENASSFEQ